MPLFFLQHTALPACCSSLLFFFRVHVGMCPSPFSGGACDTTATVTSFLHCKVAGRVPPFLPSPAGLFIYSLHKGVPQSHSPELKMPHPHCYVSFFYSAACLLFSFFFLCFPGQGSVSPGGYADFSQGSLWEYSMLLICSPEGLSRRLGAGVWWCGSPPGFSV
jgi:hypothetical protein